jgi:hypothetical protein
MDNFTMPHSFPMDEFRAFGLATRPFFPATLSNEDLNDPIHRRTHFDWAWQAVRYRYRGAAESCDEFKALLSNPSEMWEAGWGDEELTYKLERCIYTFFVSGLSVFDSFAYCLYFLGHAIQPGGFPEVANPRKITRSATAKALSSAFPQAAITGILAGLPGDARFSTIDGFRNILAHRLSGRRSVRSSSTLNADGTHTTDWHEETWHIPGAADSPTFDEEMLQRNLDDIAAMLKPLTTAAREFAESHTRAAGANN